MSNAKNRRHKADQTSSVLSRSFPLEQLHIAPLPTDRAHSAEATDKVNAFTAHPDYVLYTSLGGLRTIDI